MQIFFPTRQTIQFLLVAFIGLGLALHSTAQAVDLDDLAKTEVLTKGRTAQAQWTPQTTVSLSRTPGYKFVKDSRLTPYGGTLNNRQKATGYFYLKQIRGSWWLIDPDGGRFISKGLNSVYINETPRATAAVKQRFGSDACWAQDTKQLLKEHGFNTLGCWSDLDRLEQSSIKMPYTLYMKLMASFARERGIATMGTGNNDYIHDAIPVFDPAFEIHCDQRFAEIAQRHAEDPWLLGVFSDNELPLRGNILSNYLLLDPDNVNRQAAEAWWKARQGSKARQPQQEDEEAFLQYVAERYFRIVTTAQKKHLPNHLYLGCRLINSSARSTAVMRAGRRYVDVWSINYYGKWTPRTEDMDRWLELSGRPFIITEWYAKGEDTGLDNLGGAGFTVQSQADRGKFYQHFALHLMAHRGCVGWHWFKYCDDDRLNPSARISNKGVLDADYRPYTPLLEPMRELNQQVYRLRPILVTD